MDSALKKHVKTRGESAKNGIEETINDNKS